jgi:NAD+ kinase|tara:strand:- start:377 stop:1090 length:714 start_codon:yes stop_codon:yes gene_type:complete
MKVAIVGKNSSFIKKQLKKYNLALDNRRPWIVISYGGDGTALLSERLYPEIPKLLLRHSSVCNKCSTHDFSEVLKALESREFTIKKTSKLIATIKNRKLIALNEINIHHSAPYAIRLQVLINNELVEPLIIGDGLIVSTPFGSSGYYQTIVDRVFKKGIGLAYINPMRNSERFKIKARNRLLKEKDRVKVKILRGPGILCSDNNESIIKLKKGDLIKIKKYNKDAKLVLLNEARTKF